MARRIEIEIVGDVNGFRKALGQAAGDTDSFGSKLGSGLATAGRIAGAALAATGVAAVGAGAKMISMASDAAEVDSKLNVVFGNTLPQVTGNLDKFSEATGASRFQMREQAADMGALLGPMLGNKQGAADMSVEFVKLATDLASFNNIPTADALEKIRAGLVGEAEPLRSLGVLLSEATVKEEAYASGIAKRGAELTETQKVQARANLIMEQTSQAQGDAERTAGSLANQMKALKNNVSDAATELGMKLAPFALDVVKNLNKAADGVGEFIGRLQAAKGFEAKVKVVLEGAESVVKKALVIGQDVGKQIVGALGDVDWDSTGSRIAKGIGEALRKGIPAAMNLAGEFGRALIQAVQEVDWVTVGREIGVGLKDGAKKGVVEFGKNFGKDIVTNVGNPSTLVAKIVGKDVGEHLGNAFGDNAGKSVKLGASSVPAAINSGVDPAIAVAAAKGRLLGSALGGGLTAALSGVGASVAATIISQLQMTELQVKQKYGIHSPSTVWAAELGAPMGEGIVQGFLLGMAELPAKVSEKVRAALERGREAVEAGQGRLGDAFANLGEYVSRQFEAATEKGLDKIAAKFDAKIAKIQAKADAATPAEKELEAIREAEAKRSRDAALTEAQAELVAAQAMEEGVEKERAVAAAKESIRQAELDNRVAGLEAQAEIERAAAEKRAAEQIAKLEATKARELQNFEERRQQMSNKLSEQLENLATWLSKHPGEYDKVQQKVMKLLASYGIPMTKAGENLGKAFAKGLRDAADEVERDAKALARIVQKYLQVKSPTEAGPMSTLDRWWSGLGKTLVGGIDWKSVDGGGAKLAARMREATSLRGAAGYGPALAGVPTRGNMTATPTGGWPERIQVVLDSRVVAEAVRTEVARQQARNR